MNTGLDQGLTLRSATFDDFDDVLKLLEEADIAEMGKADYDASDLRADWTGEDLGDITRVAMDADGRLAGYGSAYDRTPTRPTGGVWTRPRDRGRGVGTALTRWVEQRARSNIHTAPLEARVELEFATHADNSASNELLRNEGFELQRYFLRMVIELDGTAPAAAWPDGITLKAFEAGRDDRAVYEAVEESFQDHWGHSPRSYDQWRKRTVDRADFQTDLWFLAMDGGEIAGVGLCEDYPEMSQGMIATVGVRRPWRRKGVALALLLHAFAEFRGRGRKTAFLGVDAQSLTGATRVYEKAGMHVAHRFALFAKELRAGVDLSTRELTA